MLAAVRFAMRGLRRTPGFTVLAILILALGIGSTTAMFTITRTILLKPLAYRDPYQIVGVTPPFFPFPRGRQLADIEPLPERTQY